MGEGRKERVSGEHVQVPIAIEEGETSLVLFGSQDEPEERHECV